MDDHSLVTAVKALCEKDPRYKADAYYFIVDAIDYTVRSLDRASKEGNERHVTGQELCEGIRRFAVEQFGPMALTVLNSWGLQRTEDFGEIVFNLIAAEKLRKTDADRKEDFVGNYDFDDAFAKPFQPKDPTPQRSEPGPPPRRRRSPPGGHESESKQKEKP
jgi:uncharacterized repeat protein (TIGR04138 family)